MNHHVLQRYPIIYICFFLSGSAGLAYEILWARILGLSFGHTVYAVTTVLAAFMGGLALGSILFGRIADRTNRPLRLYAFLEILIGLYCLAAPALLALVRKGYLHFYPTLMHNAPARTLAQFALAFAVLVIPTTLMGGTLPAVGRAIIERKNLVGSKIALLYGTNTMGAAVGAFATGYLLLPAMGIRNTNFLGAGINLLVGITVFLLFGNTTIPANKKTDAQEKTLVPMEKRLAVVLLSGFAVSGAVAMVYQVAWTRALVLVIGSSTYAFSAILVTFLAGLAMGSFLYTRISRRGSASLFAWIQAGIGLSAFFLIPFFAWLPAIFLKLFAGFEASYGYIQLIQFLVVALVILLPTTLMGMTVPCLMGILVHNMNQLGKDVGRYYAANTAGAIAGAVLCGFFLIPAFGSQNTLALGISLNLLVATSIFLFIKPALRAFLIPVCFLVISGLFLMPHWDREVMNAGVSIYPDYFEKQKLESESEGREILFFKEGISSTIAVIRKTNGSKIFRINGKADASTDPDDMETAERAVLIPMVLHPNPRKAAVIGIGSGVSVGVATLYDTIDQIDVVEIEPAAVTAARYFDEENQGALTDHRVTVHLDDALAFLEGTADKYDIIISEPSNPWIAGIADLFTVQFLQNARRRLNPGGIMSFWIQGYSLGMSDFKTAVRTFMEVFPETILWQGGSGDFILTGFNVMQMDQDFHAVTPRLEKAGALTLFARDDLPMLPIFLGAFRLGPARLKEFTGSGPLITQDRNTLEFTAPKTLYRSEIGSIYLALFNLRNESYPGFLVDRELEDRGFVIDLGRYFLKRYLPSEAAWAFEKAPSLVPNKQVPPFPGQAGIDERFEGEFTITLIPDIDFNDPEPERYRAYRRAYMTWFTRISGIVPGAGQDGGRALVIKTPEDIGSAGYHVPVILEPSEPYQLTFAVKGDLPVGSGGGVSITRLNSLPEHADKPARDSVTGAQSLFFIEGPGKWQQVTVDFRSDPDTRMGYLSFFQEGNPGSGRITFDNIRLAPGQGN